MKYSFTKGLGKGAISVLIFAVPIILMDNPAWANLTIGGLLLMGVNFLKVKYMS